jgi:hypothetical protein
MRNEPSTVHTTCSDKPAGICVDARKLSGGQLDRCGSNSVVEALKELEEATIHSEVCVRLDSEQYRYSSLSTFSPIPLAKLFPVRGERDICGLRAAVFAAL